MKKNFFREETFLQKHGMVTFFAVTVICLSIHAVAFGEQDTIENSPLEIQFNKLDSNQDKKISRSESEVDAQLNKNFTLADTDNNGFLTYDEYYKFKNKDDQNNLLGVLNDSLLTAKVKTELIREIGIEALEISVETHRGLVILSGFVESEDQSRLALEITSTFSDVQSIKNALVVKG